MEVKQSFSTSEVAKHCHVTPDTIRKWAEAGRIRVFKTPGGHRRIRREDLIDFLRRHGMPIHPDLRQGGARVLLVEPDSHAVDAFRRAADSIRLACTLEVAEDWFQAGMKLCAFRPDVVFLDVNIPGADGPAVCRQIKAFGEDNVTRVVVTSPAGDGHLAAAALREGACAQLSKPFTTDEFRDALRKAGVDLV